MRPDCTPLKTCTKCGVALPADREHFYGRQRGDRLVLDARCKDCVKTQTNAYRIAHPEQAKRYAAGYRERHRDQRRAYNRRYDAEHREERTAYKRRWLADHPDKAHEYSRRHYAAHRAQEITRSRTYYEQTAGDRREHAREWRSDNPWYSRSPARITSRRNYAARRRGAEGSHTQADVAAQRTRQKGRCYWCGAKVGCHYHVDHVVPLARGGSNWPDNIVIACASCNTSRKAKLPHEWGNHLL